MSSASRLGSGIVGLGLVCALWCLPARAEMGSLSPPSPIAMAGSSEARSSSRSPVVRHRLTAGPALVVLGIIPLEYEVTATETLALAVGLKGLLPWGGLLGGRQVLGAGGALAARWFPSGDAPGGAFFGPQLDLEYTEIRADGSTSRGTAAAITGMVGYTSVSTDGFTWSFGAGAGGAFDTRRAGTANALQLAISLHANLGYGW